MGNLPGIKRATTAAAAAGLATLALASTGCIQDTDCGICDPDNLILESISGINYQSDKIHILNPECEGDDCPAPISSGSYFIEEIIECEETEEAQASVDAAEYCRLSPLVTAFGIEFVFNNLLDPTSIELVRKRPDNPQLFEVYDWKTDVLQVQGPITRFNGDYRRGDRESPDAITRLVNLSCIDNLRDEGESFSFEDYADPANNPCNEISPATGLPRKMRMDSTIKAARGIWTAAGNSCSSPEEGPDTCCSYCEYLLSTKVDRYGVSLDGSQVLSPNPMTTGPDNQPYGAAIDCGGVDEVGTVIDKFEACADFRPSVDRSDEEQSWEYFWCPKGEPATADCELRPDVFKVPLFDMLRQTHPDNRPRGLENRDARCNTTSECSDVHDLTGTECIGETESGNACLADAYDDGSCTNAVCRPQWVVTCRYNDDTTGAETAYCQDRRFATAGTAACLLTTTGVEEEGDVGLIGQPGAGVTINCEEGQTGCDQAGAGNELSRADWDENGRISAAEGCQGSLYGGSPFVELDENGRNTIPDGFNCDPFYQTNLVPKPLYQRDENLPDPTRRCICPDSGSLESNRGDLEEDGCFDTVERGCYDRNGDLVDGREGQYAVKFVSRAGGIVYDPAIKGFDWRPADLGGIPRADIENCAENNVDRLVGALNRHDGWRSADTFTPENFEDYDRAMCSGQEYTVVFAEPGNDDGLPFVIDKADNTLAGKSVYTFETSQFHVQPGSGFPTDNLRIGACDDFSLRFSNKYDASPENMSKLQMFRVTCEGEGDDRECSIAAPDPACDSANPPSGACCPGEGSFVPVAGGSACYETSDELEAARQNDPCAAPCLTIDIENQFLGEVGVEIDPVEFGQFLEINETYRLLAPTAATLDQATSDPAVYAAVFWDACGMPLIAEDAEPYNYDFTIDTPKCREDADNDGIPFSCDNADDNFNPDQADIDGDNIGDVVDLCPVAGGDANNTADSDNDGVGNECDTCRRTLTQYNADADAAAVPDYMMVRNIPNQGDFDNDGVGDVCDNCVVTANCEDFGPNNPYEVAEAIEFDNDDVCQRDSDQTMVGDECEGAQPNPNAFGPIGFGDQDDFDQDGIPNIADGCPRQPLPEVALNENGEFGQAITCSPETAETDCGPGRACTPQGICNHLDSDSDGVGNSCDTCAFVGNPSQTMEGGAQDDDPDGDFVGEVCEIGAEKGCGDRKNARPFGFYSVAAAGNCCTTSLVEADEATVTAAADRGVALTLGDLLVAGTCTDPLDLSTCQPLTAPHPELPNARDAEGNIILEIPVRTRANCSEDDEKEFLCASLPAALEVEPGVLVPPPGCDEELAEAGITAIQNLRTPLTDLNFADQSNPLDALWQNICFLPQVDQDFDGIGDPCDKCPFAFDPTDAEFVDANGRLWPNDGAACNGDFLPDNICEIEESQSGETGEDTDGGSSGGGGGSTGG
ncbi:MAG: thrombospondin type 3 repeat-containing protein [Myxococcota bacterium]